MPRQGKDRAGRLWTATLRLRREVEALRFLDPVRHVYDPLQYAAAAHREYVKRFANGRKKVVFLGMNPGPFGMAQTGVPFGEVSHVRDWLGIEARIGRPPGEHPKRPVLGFDCSRREVSGMRLWGAVAGHWGAPEKFFSQHYVANYCPLLFLEESGRNRTPDKLPAGEREPLFASCDRHLERMVEILEPSWVVGVGRFAAERARLVLAGSGASVAQILHPSPANPRANRGWQSEAETQLRELGLCGKRGGSR